MPGKACALHVLSVVNNDVSRRVDLMIPGSLREKRLVAINFPRSLYER
jgi:hypothetical protein